jgi:hypothetical protein
MKLTRRWQCSTKVELIINMGVLLRANAGDRCELGLCRRRASDARVQNGFISLSDCPGIGFEGQYALYRIMRELAGH